MCFRKSAKIIPLTVKKKRTSPEFNTINTTISEDALIIYKPEKEFIEIPIEYHQDGHIPR